MRWSWLILGALVACGRIGYDQREVIDAAVDGTPPCPPGTTELSTGSPVCIEQVERGNLDWLMATDACAAVGRRLCSDGEWLEACQYAVGLVDMANDGAGASAEWEWVAEESGGVAQKRGYADCTDTSSHVVTDPYDFRCCVAR